MIIRNKSVIVVIIGLIGVILSCSVAYAALSTTLNLTVNKVTQNAMTWNIGFQTGTVAGTGAGECGSATVAATAISGVSPVLSKGEACTYQFTLQNNGTIGGKISAINITKPLSSCTTSGNTLTCGHIVYKLLWSDNSNVAVGNTIAAKSGSTATTKVMKLTITHDGTNETSDYTQSGFVYTVTFAQN